MKFSSIFFYQFLIMNPSLQRNHTRPAISRVLLVSNFYDHIGLRQMNPDELEAADDWLEYEDSETYQHFL